MSDRFFCRSLSFVCAAVLLLAGCRSSSDEPVPDPLFQLLSPAQTGINFTNSVTDTKEMNILNYHNFYNGGGVAIGDINNDGKPDVFFTSNQGSNKLYLNKGNMVFEDITDKAGMAGKPRWHTGVTMVDINGDGWLDIYVCNAGMLNGTDRSNELYINQKNGTFKEEAHEYGLDDKGASTQALFFDYDHDGDLDCFVLNNSQKSIDNFGYKRDARLLRDTVNGDRLYRNDNGKFTDVSIQAGIYGSEISFGLGIVAGDVNNDGWEDLYICNDFFERDYLYINQHDGTFKEVINDAMGHISNGSMGVDMVDFNNDGFLDIFTSEMLPENDYRLKTTIKFDEYDVQNARNLLDFHHQFTGNSLQLNNQDGTFSEIGQLAGVDATGWSWSALGFDFDNDGWRDIYVCNGIKKDLTDQNFLSYFNSQEIVNQMKQGGFSYMDILNKMPALPLVNFAFMNQKNLRFSDKTKQLGFNVPSFSSGSAYGDLDGDGDLDLVVSNENVPAFVYRNMSSETLKHHYIKIKLNGTSPNTLGVGARVTVFTPEGKQVEEQMLSRGFQSSVDPVLNIGLNNAKKVDSLVIRWPNEKIQVLQNIRADTLLTLNQSEALLPARYSLPVAHALYTDVSGTDISGSTRHHENTFVDFDIERLLPKMLSTESPKLAVGDVNGDGLEDFYMGSASGDTAKIFLQQPNGHFVQKPQPVFITDRFFENTSAVFFDADGDGDLDLGVVSGGNQSAPGSSNLRSRLYLNDGKGNFSAASNGWPLILADASCIRVLDFNSDGKPDIFIGARNVPGKYGFAPSSFLLMNEGEGKFADVTATVAPELQQLGMVTDAQWADLDGNGKNSLVIVGDWMPVTIYQYANGKFKKRSELPHSSGWWNCISIADVDGDGKLDLLAGNFGLNSNIKADSAHPAKLYADDFDKNGLWESIPVYYKNDGKAYPYYLKGELESQVPEIRKRFLQYSSYAGKGMEEIFSKDQIKHALKLTVEQTQTCIFLNKGNGEFTMQALPVNAQLSPVFGIKAMDLDGDGKKDIFCGGNFFGLKPQTGRFDASYGTTLLQRGKDRFEFVLPKQSGLFVKGEVRDIATIKMKGSAECIIVSMNNDRLHIFRKQKNN